VRRVRTRMEVLGDRFATVVSTVATTTASVAGKEGEIAALRRELDAKFARLETATPVAASPAAQPAEIEALRKDLAALSKQKLPKNIDGRVDDLKASLGVLTQRLETLSSTVATTAAGLAGREGEVAALRRHFDEGNAALQVEIAKLRAAVDPKPVAELGEAVKSLAGEATVVKRDGQRRS